jgi:hypothetical protein
MPNRKAKAIPAKATVASVVQEMAKPRLASSVRTYLRSGPFISSPKFCEGEWVHNCITKEDGQVMRSYQGKGVYRYEVFVPTFPGSWIEGYNSSDWAEHLLEHSAHQFLN